MSEQQSHSIEIENNVCRNQQPDSYPERTPVPEDKVSWSIIWPEYTPQFHDEPRADTDKAKDGDYADPDLPDYVDWSKRSTWSSTYIDFDHQGYPLNPVGRTGIEGRGMLNAWGPTKAADAIITRDGPNGEPEILVITRSDNGKVATIGGKLEVNSDNEVIESSVEAVRRETEEEAGIELDFGDARIIYIGYVDDERNTDNAWMETTGYHKHLTYEESLALVLKAKEEDVENPEWRPATAELLDSLNASCGQLARMALGNRVIVA